MSSAFRLAIFVSLSGAGMLILAGVVLLPAYARFAFAQWERDCLATRNDNDQARIAAQDRLIEDLPEDPVLAKRFAMTQFRFVPRQEIVLAELTADPPPLVRIAEQRLPAAPDGWAVRASGQVIQPRKRMLLIACSMVLVLGALWLSRPPKRRPTDIA